MNFRVSDPEGRKRRYKAVLINNLTDAEQEAAETQSWLEFALKCKYINKETFKGLDEKYENIFAKLITMEGNKIHSTK